jgi:hypothetical protein
VSFVRASRESEVYGILIELNVHGATGRRGI